jgi:hypothetical protein
LYPINDEESAVGGKTEAGTLRTKRKYNKKFRRLAERHVEKMKL